MKQAKLIAHCYKLLFKEISNNEYSQKEKELLSSNFLYYGRYLNPITRPYFKKTVFPEISYAIDYFGLKYRPNQTILDLGCGLGMQSIIFAAMGAKVVAVDFLDEGIELAKKRIPFYEKAIGMKLDITFVNIDFREAKDQLESYQFDSVFSMSSFSYMLPIEKSISCLEGITKKGARLYLYEENKQSIYGFHKKFEGIPMHNEIRQIFIDHGFKLNQLSGVCSVPPIAWKGWLFYPASILNAVFALFPFLSFSYAMKLEKGA